MITRTPNPPFMTRRFKVFFSFTFLAFITPHIREAQDEIILI